jgi:hypothetical protein
MTLSNFDPARAPGPILPPYTPDPYRPGARRARLISFLVVIGFCFIWGFGFALFAPNLVLFFAAPAVILTMVVIWALPDSRNPPVATLTNLLTTFMICLVMWPNYIALALPGLPWITMTRLTGFPLLTILLICVSTSSKFRSETAQAMRASPLVSNLMIAFTVLCFLSIGVSKTPIYSFDSFVNAQINWTAVFFSSVYIFQKPGRIEKMARLLWWTTIPIGIITILEVRVHHPLWAGHIPSFLQIDDPYVKIVLSGNARAGVYRAESTFSSPLGLSEYISLVLPFVAQFALGPYKTLTRVSAAITIPFLLYVVILSGARLGLVGSFVALALTGFVSAGMRWKNDRRSFLSPLITLAYPVFMALVVLSSFFVSAVRRIIWTGGGAAYSNDARKIQFAMGMPKVYAHPWGYGIGRAAETLGFAPFGFVTIDSYYLTILLEFGFIGFIIFYGMFLIGSYKAMRVTLTYKGPDQEMQFLKPLVISLVAFMIVKSVYSEIANHPVVFMMLGMILALLYRASRAAAAPVAAPRGPSSARQGATRPGMGNVLVGSAGRPF